MKRLRAVVARSVSSAAIQKNGAALDRFPRRFARDDANRSVQTRMTTLESAIKQAHGAAVLTLGRTERALEFNLELESL
jgi:hypothetical protein